MTRAVYVQQVIWNLLWMRITKLFLTSNIAPQVRKFNNGVWNRLEQKVRFWAVKYDGVYVVTGGVLEPTFDDNGKPERFQFLSFFIKFY